MRKYLLALLVHLNLYAYPQQSNDSLITEAVRTDSLFWVAYNQCDLSGMMQYIPHDIEFYHDKGGITRGDSAFKASIQKGICADHNKYHLRRAEVPGTAKVYPMTKNGRLYGVLMTGKHIFYRSQNGEKEHADGQAQYTDLWLLQNGLWKMGRVFSYDHQPIHPINETPVTTVSPAILKEYTGKYKGRKMGSITVQSAKGHLVIISGDARYNVYPSSSSMFFTRERDITFQFAKKGAGIMDVIMRENGVIIDTYTAARR